MRVQIVFLVLVLAVLVSACDFWPKDLKPLAASISQQVSGEATVWLLGGDSIVINVVGSPLYEAPQTDLELLATDIANQASDFSEAPLVAIVITFYLGQISENPGKMREFVFLLIEDKPVLQPDLDIDATGPLSLDEMQASIDRLGETFTEKQMACVQLEAERLAILAGDPEELDPASVDFLPKINWRVLDSFGKRIILAQAIVTKASFVCISTNAWTMTQARIFYGIHPQELHP